MALGRRTAKQAPLFVASGEIATSPGHPFYERLNELLKEAEFDRWVEERCAGHYSDGVGRPSIPPGVYFRMLLIGYFEGLGEDRAIAWRCADSLSLRTFLGFGVDEATPNHSSLSRIRDRLPLEVHAEVFSFVLKMLEGKGLLKGRRIAVDATTIEANAAMRQLVRKDDGRNYDEYLTDLAKESGIEKPGRSDLVRMDKKRKKRCSNQEWQLRHDADARIARMKDGRTRAAYRPEHAVDLETEALVAVDVEFADAPETATVMETLHEAQEELWELDEPRFIEQVVLDKGYDKGELVREITEDFEARSYVPERKRTRPRKWKRGQEATRRAVRNNRRRTARRQGRALQRRRSEVAERSFAHVCDTGGLRRMTLRGMEKVRKRYVLYGAAYNLALLMRRICGRGTPRGLAARLAATVFALWIALKRLLGLRCAPAIAKSRESTPRRRSANRSSRVTRRRREAPSSTGC
ncbi:MAG: transposase [Gaiellales bacterium]